MAVLREHIPYFADILGLEGFLKDPVLVFGFQDCLYKIRRPLSRGAILRAKIYLTLLQKRRPLASASFRDTAAVPPNFQAADLQQILGNYGSRQVSTLDLFDVRADFRHDMNYPLPAEMKRRFGTVIDVGSLEHVFDTKQCLANLFELVADDGHLMLHAPCNGHFDHGFHTFSPECLLQALDLNGFEIRYLKYSTSGGVELTDPGAAFNAVIWIVARKLVHRDHFVIPQQGRWTRAYGDARFPIPHGSQTGSVQPE